MADGGANATDNRAGVLKTFFDKMTIIFKAWGLNYKGLV
jgi:hypothetical protein